MASEDSRAAGASERYAQALFDLADANKALDAVRDSLNAFTNAMSDNADLRAAALAPTLSADDKAKGLTAVARAAGLHDLAVKFIGMAAQNRRAAGLPAMAKTFNALVDQRNGVTRAQAIVATPLSAEQTDALKAALARALGREVEVDVETQADLIGGLIVKIGSRMFDNSLRAKLEGMTLAMKEA
ncbi:MAG: F0F1 ATP synthase subunit delta [Maricaulaceae bacterium]